MEKMKASKKSPKWGIFTAVSTGVFFAPSLAHASNWFTGLFSKAVDLTVGNVLEGIAWIFYQGANLFAEV
ncbi:MAG TPA: hypothetical protein VLB83_05255, partial [Candidatus Paceibacterota bacterium]|nr:hypothetical protein [Candidatus Paceibacterota bacterium]